MQIYLSWCFAFLGEKLSKQQLQHSNIIKKLRVKEKESDAKIIKQQKKMKEQEEELGHLQQVCVEYSLTGIILYKTVLVSCYFYYSCKSFDYGELMNECNG